MTFELLVEELLVRNIDILVFGAVWLSQNNDEGGPVRVMPMPGGPWIKWMPTQTYLRRGLSNASHHVGSRGHFWRI
jgi:hypothetical protein